MHTQLKGELSGSFEQCFSMRGDRQPVTHSTDSQSPTQPTASHPFD